METSTKDYVVHDAELASKIIALAQKAGAEPLERFKTFQAFGQLLKPIHKIKEFKAAEHLFWTEILRNAKEWKGQLLVPDYYRRNKTQITYPDIGYAIKDAWLWYILYPEEAGPYFKQTEDGVLSYSDINPKTRIMEKEIVYIATRNEVGAVSYTAKKPFPHQILKNGFTYEQLQWLTEYQVVGLFVFEPQVVLRDKIEKKKIEPKITASKKSTQTKIAEKNVPPKSNTAKKTSYQAPSPSLVPESAVSLEKQTAIAKVRAELGLPPLPSLTPLTSLGQASVAQHQTGTKSQQYPTRERFEPQPSADYLEYQEVPEYTQESLAIDSDMEDALIIPMPKAAYGSKAKSKKNVSTRKSPTSKTVVEKKTSSKTETKNQTVVGSTSKPITTTNTTNATKAKHRKMKK